MDIQEAATEVVKALRDKGFKAYFVGGWVRDHLLGMERADIDIATSATPEEVMRLFPKTVPVGISFGVVLVMHGGFPFEVSSFRREGRYIDGRHPQDVEMGTEEEDVQRRDFTINGMFFDPFSEEVIDYVGGREDLESGIVRAIGDASCRFVEDRLRMIRAVRIVCRFQFALDPDTERAIEESAGTLFPAVAIERVWQEFKKMADNPHFDEAIVMMHRLGLLPVIFPMLKEVSVREIERRVSALSAFPDNAPLILKLLLLFPDINDEDAESLCRYMKTSSADIKLVELFFESKELVEEGDMAEPVQWARFYAKEDALLCLGAIASTMEVSFRQAFLQWHRHQRDVLSEHISRIKDRCPVVTSSMLRMQGIEPSPLMGALLTEAERISINGDIYDPEEIIRRLKISEHWPS